MFWFEAIISAVFVIGFFASLPYLIYRRIKDGRPPKPRPKTKIEKEKDEEKRLKTLPAEEQFKIAKSLVEGNGEIQDERKWLMLVKTSANKGHRPAMYALAMHYKGTENDVYLKWLKIAAQQGYAAAGLELGETYLSGLTVGKPLIEKDILSAERQFRDSALTGDATAQKRLAEFYEVNYVDEEKAIFWYAKAAKQGDVEAALECARLYADAEEYEAAEKMYLKASETGGAVAEIALGDFYCSGETTDYKKAFQFYSKAAERGDGLALCKTGEMYLNGRGVLKDEVKAAELFAQADGMGTAYGSFLLGKCYFYGDGVGQNYKKAILLYKKAAVSNSGAQLALGECYFTGSGVKKNIKLAMRYFVMSAENYNAEAMYWLGEIYYGGTAIKKDSEKAKSFWRKAARYGNADAVECLKLYYGEVA